MIGDDLKRMHEQRYQHLAEELHEKNSEYHHLVADIERAKRNAEITIAQLEKKHTQELDELNAKARLSSQEHTTQMRALNMVLQSSMEKLKSRCQDLREKEKLRQTQGERIQLEQAKMENQWKLDVVNEQAEIQKKHQAAQMALIRKHEMENEHLADWIQFKKMTLAKKHLKELENQRLEEMRESKKFMQLAHSIEDPEYLSDKGAMDLEEKITLMEKQKGELIEELEDLKLDNEAHNETILALTMREKIANDEVQQARQAAELVIEDVGSTSTLYIRKMGEIDEVPWKKACEERFSNHKGGWEVAFRTKYSRWEERIRNPNFAPFTYVLVGGNRERHIDYSDKKLLNLQEKLGNAVVKTVVRALEEIEEFNSCGRYPVSRIWNAKEGRIATLKEVIEYLRQLLKQPKQRKRARLNVNI